jgi:hypothetical protein
VGWAETVEGTGASHQGARARWETPSLAIIRLPRAQGRGVAVDFVHAHARAVVAAGGQTRADISSGPNAPVALVEYLVGIVARNEDLAGHVGQLVVAKLGRLRAIVAGALHRGQAGSAVRVERARYRTRCR